MTPKLFFGTCQERERTEFLRQYQDAVAAAREPAGYRQLPRLLHAWRLAVIAARRVGYYEELDAVRRGTAQTRPAELVLPDWQQRLGTQSRTVVLADLIIR
jgi:hypothetical protein